MKPTWLAVAAAGLVAACTPPGPSGDATPRSATVLTVNDTTLSQDGFAVYAQTRTSKPLDALTDEERERLMNEVVQLLVVADEARKRGLATDRELRGQIELQELNLLAQSLIRQYIEDNPVTDDAIDAEQARRAAGVKPLEYKARHILVNTEEEARSLIAQLDYGSDFAELAREHSTGPSAATGGDLGWFGPGQMVKPFADAVAAMEKGTYSKEPVQTRFGWHVILAEDSRELAAPPPEQVRNEIGPQMQKEAIESFIESLKASATIRRSSD